MLLDQLSNYFPLELIVASILSAILLPISEFMLT